LERKVGQGESRRNKTLDKVRDINVNECKTVWGRIRTPPNSNFLKKRLRDAGVRHARFPVGDQTRDS